MNAKILKSLFIAFAPIVKNWTWRVVQDQTIVRQSFINPTRPPCQVIINIQVVLPSVKCYFIGYRCWVSWWVPRSTTSLVIRISKDSFRVCVLFFFATHSNIQGELNPKVDFFIVWTFRHCRTTIWSFFKLLDEQFKKIWCFVTNRQDLIGGSICDVSGCLWRTLRY